VPSLDCRAPFLRWSLDRHHEACADDQARCGSLTFCSCVDTIAERAAAAETPEAAAAESQKVARCIELPDAFALPELSTLAPAS
jgi:hypothetical protein